MLAPQANGTARVTVVVTQVILTFATMHLAMRFASSVQKVLVEDSIEPVACITSLLLSATAVQMIADSLPDFVRTWG
ncbi:hypothetical protein KNN17_13700 [Arthrobacter bambusae]|uniref:hypothetical protein n=1 Tax=Arthrobacter bambusae TaxID=1338426 RepID=UPI001F50CB71|nr:hypothetical protein [Arthrobacter bambusae]MCI0142631.1 hypothetical protein [Arthrobacter bambusae]